jgi:lipoate-protein ligase A
MKFLDLSFSNPAANLACDEALMESMEADPSRDACLRVWESKKYFVVLGHGNSLHAEVNVAACLERQIPILRRISGGGTVLQGPGCVNYSLLLRYDHPRLRNVDHTFHFVLKRHRSLIQELSAGKARIEGISDLTVDGRKCSGNAQYRKAQCVLVHGTFLLHFDVNLIGTLLSMPSKQPAYRADRPHHAFVMNLNVAARQLFDGLRKTWGAHQSFGDPPLERIDRLVRDRYERKDWSAKFA